MGLLSKTIGIDIGTANTLIYTKDGGCILSEPSVVAVDRVEKKVLSVGVKASEMIKTTSGNVVAVHPLRNGVIADFDITSAMIRFLIKQAKVGGILKPRAVVSVPSQITQVQSRAVVEAVALAGVKEVFLIEEPMAAALGAGMEVSRSSADMIVNIGGGITEIAVISLGGIVASKSLPIAGDALNDSIISYIRKYLSLNIGDRMAEEIKISIGSAYKLDNSRSITVRGRDVLTGLPKECIVTDDQIREAMSENIGGILEGIKYILENIPPELSADIMKNGMVISGGGALILGLDKLIYETLKIPVHLANNPLECVAIGTGKYISEVKKSKKRGALNGKGV